MALKITTDCINCGACITECPNNAIYMGGDKWSIAEGTNVNGKFKLFSGKEIIAENKYECLSDDFFYIVPEKCTECVGFHSEQQCAVHCPVNCCVLDSNYLETNNQLIEKKTILHS